MHPPLATPVGLIPTRLDRARLVLRRELLRFERARDVTPIRLAPLPGQERGR